VAVAGVLQTLEHITMRWLSVLGCAIAPVEVIPAGEGVGFVGRAARVRPHRDVPRAPASVFAKLPADGAACGIGVARRVDERAVLFNRELAASAGVARRVGGCRAG